MKNMLGTPPRALIPALTARCPVCKSPIVERTVRASGVKFAGCSAFPQCRFTHPLCDVEMYEVSSVLYDLLDEQGKLALFPARAVIWMPHAGHPVAFGVEFNLRCMVNGYVVHTSTVMYKTQKGGTRQVHETEVHPAMHSGLKCCPFIEAPGGSTKSRVYKDAAAATAGHFETIDHCALAPPGWSSVALVPLARRLFPEDTIE